MLIPNKYGLSDVPDKYFEPVLATSTRPLIFRCLGGSEFPFFVEGYILMWHWETKMFYIYRSLDNAIRGCVHTKAKYSRADQQAGAAGELVQLSKIVQRHGMLWDLVARWNSLSTERRQAFTEASLATAAALVNARNHLRVGMAERAKMASTIIDSLGRVNPSRTKALHATIKAHAEKRSRDVRSINVHTDYRMTALLDQNEHNLDVLRQATAEVKLLADPMDETKKLPKVDSLEIRQAIIRLEDLFSGVHDIPYTHFFRRCLKDDLWPIRTAFVREDITDVIRRVRRVRDAFEVFWFSRDLAELRLRLAFALSRRPHRPTELDALKTEFEALRDTMQDAQARGLEKRLRNPPLKRVIRHLSIAFLEWDLEDFEAMAKELDKAEEVF